MSAIGLLFWPAVSVFIPSQRPAESAGDRALYTLSVRGAEAARGKYRSPKLPDGAAAACGLRRRLRQEGPELSGRS
jgi:hypothetical protein